MNRHQGAFVAEAGPSGSFARGMVFLGYALLFMAIPTAGTSALLALVLAYARRDGPGPVVASHYRFQIRIFWIGLALTGASIALAISALMDAGRSPPMPVHVPVSPHAQVISYTPAEPRVRPEPADVQVFTYNFGSRSLTWRTRALLEGYGAAVLLAFACLWSVGAPIYGAARLASGRAMGHSPD